MIHKHKPFGTTWDNDPINDPIIDIKTTEIIERSSGYWIVDKFGAFNGPYTNMGEAVDDLKKLEEEANK